MLFNSYPFIFLFLPVVLCGFYLCSALKQSTLAKVWLLFASLAFYSYWDIRFLPILMGSILFNFAMGNAVYSTSKYKKIALLVGISCDLLLLFYFKYVNFFLSSFTDQLFFEVALPLGISFFTFTQIAYLVDVYQGEADKEGFINYALFVTIFPHLIAGPILHHKEMISQFKDPKMFLPTGKNFANGLFLFSVGLFKKVMIADYLAKFIGPMFDSPVIDIPLLPAWFGAICYTLQLYFDFSGYSDMAVGLGLFFNMHLPINFNSPYKADSIIDFWRRWHMTLSTFLRNYLYIPLGGNRSNRQLRNLFLTMVLGGLWHGAGWTFILWGACHGLFLTINHLWRKGGIKFPVVAAKGLTLLSVIVAWVLFRSPTVEKALSILNGMAGLNGVLPTIKLNETYFSLTQPGLSFGTLQYYGYDFLLLFLLSVIVISAPNSIALNETMAKRPRVFGMITAVMTLCVILRLEKISEFLYYQF